MPVQKPFDYTTIAPPSNSVLNEQGIEESLIRRLECQKYHSHPDNQDRESLDPGFSERFETLNRVRLYFADNHACHFAAHEFALAA